MGNVLRESLNYCCSKAFCYFSKKKNLAEKKTGHLAIILWNFEIFYVSLFTEGPKS